MRMRDMTHGNVLMMNLAGLMLLVSTAGCLPAPQRQQTDVQPAADVVITIDKGKTVVGPPAKASPEGEENTETDKADSEK